MSFGIMQFPIFNNMKLTADPTSSF